MTVKYTSVYKFVYTCLKLTYPLLGCILSVGSTEEGDDFSDQGDLNLHQKRDPWMCHSLGREKGYHPYQRTPT